MTWFCYNGKLYKDNECVVNTASRGLRYGDGLFETMKLQQGKLILANEHFARLWKGMHTLQFDTPRHFTPENITASILKLAAKNGHSSAARIRLTILRGPGGLYDPASHIPEYIIETWPLPPGNEMLNSNGLVLGIYREVKKSCDILSNIKHNNFLPYAMAALYAKKEKWNDAVLLNTAERVCETTIANLFLVKGDTISTPALSEGCIAGVMREQLIQQLKKAGISTIQQEITVQDLLDADEVLLTNSIYNLRWVQRIGEKEYQPAFANKIYPLLHTTIS